MAIDSNYDTYTSGRFRIGGLVSGIDVDSIIQDLMRIEQMKVDRLKQDRQLVEWRKEAYREITNLLRAFQDEFFNISKTDMYMLSSNAYKTFSVASSAEEYVTATANASALEGNYTITKIESLAAPTILKGVSWVFSEGRSLDSTLEQLGLVEADGRADFSINGVRFLIGTPTEGEELPDDTVVIDPTKTTMRQFVNLINTNDKAGVNIFYSSIEKSFVLQTKATGAATDILLDEISGTFLQDLGLTADGAEKIAGTDARLYFA